MCSEPHAQANILSRRALLRSGLAVGLTTLLTTRNVDAAVDFDIDRFGDKELKVSAINRVKQNLRNVLAERPELLGTFVLLALHDGLTYDQSTGAGGPNGSLRFEGDWEQNKELGDAMEVIKDVRKLQRDQMSFADTCCFAGAVAVEITGGPRIRIQLGREDAAGQDPIGNSDGIAPGRSANEIVDAFNTSGLNGPRDAVLFHGAFGSLNDIGRTRLEKLKKQKELADEDDEEGDTISGDANNVTYGKTQGGKRGAVLVSSNVSNLTFGGAKFSNDYLKFMLEADKKKSADLSDRDRKMLAHPGIRDNVTLYAGKNKKFVTDFADVFEKVTMLGSRYESTKLEDQ